MSQGTPSIDWTKYEPAGQQTPPAQGPRPGQAQQAGQPGQIDWSQYAPGQQGQPAQPPTGQQQPGLAYQPQEMQIFGRPASELAAAQQRSAQRRQNPAVDFLTAAERNALEHVTSIGELIQSIPRIGKYIMPESAIQAGQRSAAALGPPQGMAGEVGGPVEDIAEFVGGDEAVKAMSFGDRLLHAGKIADWWEKSSPLQRAVAQRMMNSARQAAVGAALGGGEAAPGERAKGAVVGGLGGAIGGAFEKVPTKEITGVAQESLQKGILGILGEAADRAGVARATEGATPEAAAREFADNLAIKGKQIIAPLDKATLGKFTHIQDAFRANEWQRTINADPARQIVLDDQRTALLSELQNAIQMAKNSGINNAEQVAEEARGVWKQMFAMDDLTYRLTKAAPGSAEAMAEGAVVGSKSFADSMKTMTTPGPRKFVPGTTTLQDVPSRLEEALGTSDLAEDMKNLSYKAQRGTVGEQAFAKGRAKPGLKARTAGYAVRRLAGPGAVAAEAKDEPTEEELSQFGLARAETPAPTTEKKTPETGVLGDIQARYPALAPHLSDVVVEKGEAKPGDERQLEFYPPWESENPHPGKITVQTYRDFQGKELGDMVAGDLMHYLGATDPRSGQPVDPEFQAMKQEVKAARTPQQEQVDRQAYQEEKQQGMVTESYEDWLDHSRIDAYIRGFVTPDKADEWRKQGWYKDPRMRQAVEDVSQYMSGASTTNVWQAYGENWDKLVQHMSHLEGGGKPGYNNPTNIKEHGEIKRFATPEEGKAAAIRQLKSFRNRFPNWTIADLNRRWAPDEGEHKGDNPPGTEKLRSDYMMHHLP